MRPAAGRAWPALRAAGALTLTAALAGGVPYALAVYVGWPLPRHVPAWAGIRVFLTSPLTNDAIIKALACLVWLLWLAFTVSVILEAAAVARGGHAPRLPVIAPVQGFAAALVSAVILTSVPLPQHAPRPALHAVLAVRTGAPPQDGPASAAPAAVPDTAQGPGGSLDLAVPGHAPQRRRVYRVVEGDNLWDIAARFLGDGERWHEIYDLNRGKPQPGGGRLTDPDLIYPGWVLALPQPAGLPAGHHPPARSGPAPPPTHRPAEPDHDRSPGPEPGQHHRQTGPRTPAAHPAGHVPAHQRRERPAGVHLPGGGLVGITLAAAISAALVAWRLHRRRAYVPRWPSPPERAEPPLPEAISALRRAHLRSLAADAADARGEPWPDDPEPGDVIEGLGAVGDDDEGLDEFGAPAGPTWQPASPLSDDGHRLAAPGTSAADGTTSGPLPAPLSSPGPARPAETSQDQPDGALPPEEEYEPPAPPARPQPAGTVVFGTRGSAEIPLAAVTAGGLGLTGPGARDTARALLIGLLAAEPSGGRDDRARVVIPEADLQQLLGGEGAAQVPGVSPGLPDGLTVTATLAAALGRIETDITRRIRVHGTGRSPDCLALIATIDPAAGGRVRAVLGAGAAVSVTGIILGDWPAGTTCRIGADGLVFAASDPALAGAEAFRLSAADTAAMLSLLRGAQGHITPGESVIPDPPPARLHAGGQAPPRSREPEEPGTWERHDQHPDRGEATADAPRRDHAPAALPGATRGPEQRPGQPPHGPVTPGNDADAAARPSASIAPEPADAMPVEITVLGAPRITAHGREIHGGRRKVRELLAFLVLRHPGGASGEAISEALWPESDPRFAARQPGLTVRNARQMLRAATGLSGAKFITLASDRYRLDPAVVGADLWRFDAALDRARAATSSAGQVAALREAAASYRGSIGEGTTWDWADAYAEPIRRRALDALTQLAELLQPADPEQALAVLDTALAYDPYNEAIYHKITAIQNSLGRPDAARRTQMLLESRLAELGIAKAPAIPASGVGASRQHGKPSRITASGASGAAASTRQRMPGGRA